MAHLARTLGVVAVLAGVTALAAPDRPTAAWIEGYVTAVSERELGMAAPRVRLDGDVLTVWTDDAVSDADRDALEAALAKLPGVREVRMERGTPPERPVETPEIEEPGFVFLPAREIFRPLLADPRWPHFSAAYQRYRHDDELGDVGAVSFGETFAILEGPAVLDGRWQLGLQAGVFSIFDLDASSYDLVNSDFLVALLASYRRGEVSVLGRLLHQSSHLGDEFLLRNGDTDRVNLSYESLDALVSWDATDFLRFYGGGGGLVHRSPSSLDPFFAQAGAEMVGPWSFWRGHVRPLVAGDVQFREENGWNPDVSARVGVQLERDRASAAKLQLVLEYYNGSSPNGQFFDRDIEYLGGGLHLHF